MLNRHEQLIRVFRETPEKARSYAMDAKTRAALLKAEPSYAAVVEQDVPLTGELSASIADDFVNHTATKQYSLHTRNGDRAISFVNKRGDLDRMVGHHITVTGLSIPEVVAAESLREASPAEVTAAAAEAPIASLNGGLQANAAVADATVAAAASSPSIGAGVAPGAATPMTSPLGVQTTVVLILKFSGGVAYPAGFDQQSYYNQLFNGPNTPNINGFMKENSYQQTSIAADIYGPLSVSGNFDCKTVDAMATAAVPVAAAAGVDFTKYNRIVFVYPVDTCYFGGLGQLASTSATTAIPHQFTYTWVPIPTNQTPTGYYNFLWLATNHEVGHNLGVNHANSLDFGALTLGPLDYTAVTPGIVTPGGHAPEADAVTSAAASVNAAATVPTGTTKITAVNTEYGDKYSDMGDGQGLFNTQHAYKDLGWIATSGGQDITTSGSFTLSPAEINSGLRALHVLRDPVSSSWVWVEFHQPIGTYQPLSMTVAPANVPNTLYSGAQLHYQDGFYDQKHTLLIDANPTAVPNNFFMSNLLPGSSFSDPFSLLTITAGTQTGSTLGVSVSYDAPCATVALSTPTLPAAGGSGTVMLTAPNTCNWSVSSNASWISFTGTTTGTGNGTVSFTATANTDTFQRNSYLTAQRQSLSIVQDGKAVTVLSAMPTATTVAPSTFVPIALMFNDNKGVADISQINFHAAGGTSPDCGIVAVNNGDTNDIDLFLTINGVDKFAGTSGNAGTMSSSSCTLDIGKSTYSTKGKIATLTLALSFPPSFTGVHNVTASANGADSSLVVPVGLVNVSTSSPVTTSLAISPAAASAPLSGDQGTTVPFTIAGTNTNFTAGSTVAMSGTGVAVSNFTVVNATTVTGTLKVGAKAAAGARTVTVTSGANVDSTTFTVNAASSTITLSPNSGLKGATVPVTITGSNTTFTAASTVTIAGDRIRVKKVTYVSPTSITAEFVLDTDTAADARMVTVTSGSEVDTASFTVTPDVTPLVQAMPATANIGDKVFVRLIGSDAHFDVTSTLKFSGADITVKDIAVLGPNEITADIVVTSAAPAGARTFTITTGTETAKGTFTITALTDTTTTIVDSGLNGTTTTLTATIRPNTGTGTVDGYVSFVENTGGGGFKDILATVPLSNGSASFPVSNLSVGVHTFSAQYLGDTTTYALSASTKNAEVTVKPTAQTITFGPLPGVTYGTSPITLTATASSKLPVTYTVSGPATLSGSVLTITSVGTVTVTASQGGNATYAAATAVSQSFIVAKATLTATAASFSRAYGAANPALTYTVTGFVNGDTSAVVSGTATLTTTATKTSVPGVYPITFATQNLVAANYTFAYLSGTLTVTGSVTLPSFTITARPIADIFYRGVVDIFLLELTSVNGFSGNVTLTCSGGPAGSKCTDFPMTVKLNGSALALSGILFPKTAAAGTYDILITGVSGSTTATATATFKVK